MERKEIMERIKKVTARVLESGTDVPDEANFIFDLGADSMQSVRLVAAFEEEFGIEMEEDQALQVQTVSDAADFIAQYLS